PAISAIPSTVLRPGRSYSSNLTPRAKLAYGCLDVVDFPAHLRVHAGLRSSRDEDCKLSGRADITEPALALFDRIEPELLQVERPRAIQIFGWKAGCHFRVPQHAVLLSWSSCAHLLRQLGRSLN